MTAYEGRSTPNWGDTHTRNLCKKVSPNRANVSSL